jgi:hypothetical protein
VTAAAASGQGVFETLEAALGRVVAAMQGAAGSQAAPDASPPEAEAGAAPGAETGHPLLAALRQVLRETVRDHVAEVEARLAAQLDRALRPLAQQLQDASAAGADTRRAVAEVSDLLMDLSHRTSALTHRSHATLELLRRLGEPDTLQLDPE